MRRKIRYTDTPQNADFEHGTPKRDLLVAISTSGSLAGVIHEEETHTVEGNNQWHAAKIPFLPLLYRTRSQDVYTP